MLYLYDTPYRRQILFVPLIAIEALSIWRENGITPEEGVEPLKLFDIIAGEDIYTSVPALNQILLKAILLE